MEADELQKAAEALRYARVMVRDAEVKKDYLRRQTDECFRELSKTRERAEQAEAELLRIANGWPKE